MLNPGYKDMLVAFCDHDVQFLLIGAYALAAHGLPRATGDIDLFVNTNPANAQRVWNALAEFGAPLGDLTVHDLEVVGTVFQIGVRPRRIDITTKIDGIDFATAWSNRDTIEIEGLSIPVIARNDR